MPRHKLNDAARDMMNNLEGSGNSVQRCLAKLWLAADGIYELRQNTGQLKRLVESSLEDYSRLLKKAHEAIGHLFFCEYSDSVDFKCEDCNAAREIMQEIEALRKERK